MIEPASGSAAWSRSGQFLKPDNVLKILGPKGPTEMDPRIFFGCQNQLPPKNAVEVYRMFNVAMLLTLSSARTTIRTAGPLWTSGGI